MRDDVAVVHVARQVERDRHRHGLVSAALLAGDGERARILEAARDGVGDDGREDVGAVEVEQPDRARDLHADVAAAVEPARDQDVDSGQLRAQPVAPLEVARRASLADQLLAVLGRLDQLLAAAAARVARDLVAAVEQAHGAVVGRQRERALGVLGGTE